METIESRGAKLARRQEAFDETARLHDEAEAFAGEIKELQAKRQAVQRKKLIQERRFNRLSLELRESEAAPAQTAEGWKRPKKQPTQRRYSGEL